jgi:hypothetical protein
MVGVLPTNVILNFFQDPILKVAIMLNGFARPNCRVGYETSNRFDGYTLSQRPMNQCTNEPLN